MEEIKAGRVTSVTDDDVAVMYTDMLRDARFMFATVLTTVARSTTHPVLFHCTAGKDRTGLSAALIQRLCGVPDAFIERDYTLTNPYRAEARFAQLSEELVPLGIDVEAIRALIGAPLPALRTALAWIDERGGTEAYVVDHLGVTRADVAALRAGLVA
jgi:protein-tyrosine phosphatase